MIITHEQLRMIVQRIYDERYLMTEEVRTGIVQVVLDQLGIEVEG